MKEYIEDGHRLYRQGSRIVVKTDDNSEKIYELEDEPVHIGKINIPLSNACTMSCLYCSEGKYNLKQGACMTETAAYQIIDAYIDWVKNNIEIMAIQLSFDYGGEPVCQIELLEKVVRYFRKKCDDYNLKSTVLMTTNGAWEKSLVPRIASNIDEIIISLDGPRELHDKYRKYKGNKSLFDEIIENALILYKAGKLKQISSVITKDTIRNPEKYIHFFMESFPGCSIKTMAVIITGDAEKNNIERVQLKEWKHFIDEIKRISRNAITIIDSKPEKEINYKYSYGCEHMRMTNWFCWLDGTISCCTDRENNDYFIGRVQDNILNMNYRLMNELKVSNYVENVDKCKECIAKYYCAGGCPEFRDGKMNCERRIEKYAKMFIHRGEV